MKSKVYLLLLLIAFSGTSIYAQEGNNNRVTVEDQGGNSEYKENDDKFRELDKQFDDLMDSFRKTYRNLYNSGFSKVNGNFSKEKLGVFISEAGIYKNNIYNNAQVSNLNNQLNDLAKVTSRSGRDYVAYFENSLLPSVEGDIASAKSIIKDIERNESKKEVSVGFGNTNNSSSNTSNSTSRTDSYNSNENSQSNTSNESNRSRSLSEALIGTWTIIVPTGTNINGDVFTIHFSSNGTGYQFIPDTDSSCWPYYWKAYFNYSLNGSSIIMNYTSIDDYCGDAYSASILGPLGLVINSSGETLTDGEGSKFKRK